MAKSSDTERRIYVLPIDLVERIRKYQGENKIASEVEAVRNLLEDALRIRDTIEDIIYSCDKIFSKSKDIKAVAREYLLNHPKVAQVTISSSQVSFNLITQEQGIFKDTGEGFITHDGENWEPVPIF